MYNIFMKYIVYVFVATLLLPAHLVHAGSCAQLSSNLKWGAKGEQVRVLQQMLNKNKATQVAALDVGSPGMEGTFFGKATYVAVKKYQELHAEELLIPQQLKTGTGYVGNATRALLNKEFCSEQQIKESSIEEKIAALKADVIARQGSQTSKEVPVLPTPVGNTQSQTKTPKISSVSPLVGNMGTTVTLSGENFAPSNDILTTTWRFNNVASSDGKTLSFVITADKNLLTQAGTITKDLPFTIVVRSGTQFSNVVTLKLE